jgi:hypothetical protein
MKRRLLIIAVFIGVFGWEASSQTLVQAKNWYLQSEYQKALPVFRKELTKKPKDASLNLWYGACLLETGKADIALPYLQLAKQRNLPDAEWYIAKYLMKVAAPDSALVVINHYLEYPKLDATRKDAAINLKTDIERTLESLQKVEDVTFIDSVIIPKSALYTAIKLAPEAGKIAPAKTAFPDIAKTIGAVYLPEKNDRIFYASSNNGAGFDIVARHRLLNDWDKEEPLSDIINSVSDELNPFYLSDGTTLYFASNRPGSFGGLDLYVTRLNNNGAYLLPDHLNMPFNSSANDYFLLIDEFSNRGYLATDRNQAKGYAIIYTFLPNPSNHMLQGKSLKELQDFANIRSIRATWAGKNMDSLLVQPEKAKVVAQHNEPETTFQINDTWSYNQESDFVSDEARNLYKEYHKLHLILAEKAKILDEKRTTYLSSTPTEQIQISDEILKLENETMKISRMLPDLEMKIRNAELAKRSK